MIFRYFIIFKERGIQTFVFFSFLLKKEKRETFFKVSLSQSLKYDLVCDNAYARDDAL